MAGLARLRRSVDKDEPEDRFAEAHALLAEADRLKALLADQEARTESVERALKAAREREEYLPGIEADVVVGKIQREVAEQAVSEIRSAVKEATEEKERHEGLLAELRARVSAAGRAACDEVLRVAAQPYNSAASALAEAQKVLALRETEYKAARDRYLTCEEEASRTLALYDSDHASQLDEDALRKEKLIEWALRNPRNAVEQLGHTLQEEARERYDKLEREAAAHRARNEERRVEAFINPKDASGREVRL